MFESIKWITLKTCTINIRYTQLWILLVYLHNRFTQRVILQVTSYLKRYAGSSRTYITISRCWWSSTDVPQRNNKLFSHFPSSVHRWFNGKNNCFGTCFTVSPIQYSWRHLRAVWRNHTDVTVIYQWLTCVVWTKDAPRHLKKSI